MRATAELMRMTPFSRAKPLDLSGRPSSSACALCAGAGEGGGPACCYDEPLANPTTKLREELRPEIPRIFEESGAIFVYATTEPE